MDTADAVTTEWQRAALCPCCIASLHRHRRTPVTAQQVMLQDVSARCSMFVLMGAEADSVLQALGITQLANQPLHTHTLLNFKGSPVMVAGSTWSQKEMPA